jgi:hypothetical protein
VQIDVAGAVKSETRGATGSGNRLLSEFIVNFSMVS